MELTLKEIPFMRYGSYFAVSEIQEGGFTLRDVHGGDASPSTLFDFSFFEQLDEKKVPLLNVEVQATETALTFTHLETKDKYVRLCFPTPTDCLIEVKGIGLDLIADKVRYDTFYQLAEGEYAYISYKKEMKYMLQSTGMSVEAPWHTVGNHSITLTLGESDTVGCLYMTEQKVETGKKKSIPVWEDVQQILQKEYDQWKESMPLVPKDYQTSRDLASYILWGNVVHAEGNISSDVTYMSKNHMQNIWSWDNCFSAMSLAATHPELAYNQLSVFMDHQAKNGAYPDFINDQYVSYSCVKPPIHAWAYKEMMSRNPIFMEKEKMEPFFLSLEKATDFWLNERRLDESGLPFYTHGNDSGWDNASVFLQGIPVASPDLAAYLVQQMDFLSEFAAHLEETDKAKMWKNKADDLYARLMSELYDGNQFIARKLGEKDAILPTTSLLLRMPLVLSYRYPTDVTKNLVEQLTELLETHYGLATEATNSPYYKEDGYWLGPIWAPVSYIAIDALYKAGYTDIAKRLARKFCEMTLVGGMAENYNAQEGTGNDDLAFAWSSSVFLLLGEKLLEETKVVK